MQEQSWGPWRPPEGRLRRALVALRWLCAAAMILALTALPQPAARAFTLNHTDNPTPGAGPALHWAADAMPVHFLINPTPPTGIATAAQWQAALKRSLATWIALPTSDLTASFVGTTASQSFASGDGNVCWAMNSGWDGGAGVLALTGYYFDVSTGALTDADMKLNGDQFTWTDGYAAERGFTAGDTAFDLESVTTHEFGHAWGLGHSLDNTGVNPGDPDYDDNGTPADTSDDQINGPNQNTMDPKTIAGESYQRSLQSDDTAAMDANYPAASVTLTRPAVLLTEPDGAGDAPAGGSYDLHWLSQYEGPANPTVAFYYTADPSATAVAALNGAHLIANNIASPKDGSASTYTWHFSGVPAGAWYVIAVVTADGKTEKDVSAGPVTVASSTLSLTAPTTAGITINPYDSYAVTWTQGGSSLGNVKIDLSIDGGVSYPYPVATAAPNTGSYSFAAPDPALAFGQPGPLTNCKIRIAYAANQAVNDTSANPFTLAANSNSLVLTAPVGGETCTAGQNLAITFNAAGSDVGDDFAIYWSEDNGASWASLNDDAHIPGPNPRTYNWVVPGEPGSYNRIQIFSLNASQYWDISPSPFTILSPGTRTFSTYPDHLEFDAVVGGGNPATQPLYLRNAGLGLLTNCTVTITGDTAVTCTPYSYITVGPAPDRATLTVGVSNGYAAAGTTTANLVFTSAAGTATNENYTVPVTVRIHAAGAVLPLTYTPATLTFTSDWTTLPPGAQTVTVVNPNLNADTLVDAYPDSFQVLLKPGRFPLAAGDSTAGGPDEQALTVLADTTAQGPGQSRTAHIWTSAADIGTGYITVHINTTGNANAGSKKGCAIGGGGGGSGLLSALCLLCAGLCILTRRPRRRAA